MNIENWDLISDIIMYAAIFIVAIFGFIGLTQLCQKSDQKGLKKIDKPIRALALPFFLLVLTYIVFDYIWVIGTAPNDPTKPSFPSTHAMLITTVFLTTALALPKYIKSKPLLVLLDLIMLVLLIIACAGRLISNNHWPADVACGIVFGIIFAAFYYLAIKEKK